MTGTGTSAQVTVGPTPLQFGLVPCGDAGGPLQVTITNSSPGAVGFTASLGLGAASPFTLDVTDGGTVPGLNGTPGTATITVTPKPIPVPASVDAGAFNDTLVVTPTALRRGDDDPASRVGGRGHPPAGRGRRRSVWDGRSPEGSLVVTVVNSGNLPATVNLDPNPGVVDGGTFSGTQVVAAADGGSVTGSIEYQPTASGPATSSLVVTTTAPVCAPLPAPTPLTATGALSVATFFTKPLGLSSTCGGGAGTQTALVIQTTGAGPLQIESASSALGTFTIVSALPMTIAPGDTGSLFIAGAAVGQGTAGGTFTKDTLSFTTNEVSTQTEPRTVEVDATLNGANLSYVGLTGNTLARTGCNDTTFSVTNTGNMPAVVVGSGGYPTDGPFSFSGTFSATGAPVINPGDMVSDNLEANLCQLTKPCSLSAAPQTFVTSSSADAGGPGAGICIPLPPLNVSLNLPISSESCQQQCCG